MQAVRVSNVLPGGAGKSRPPALDVPSSALGGGNRLPVLVGEIASAHSACRKASRAAVRHAVEAGQRLIEAKELVPHGAWLPWLAEHLPDISARTAQRYMRAAEAAGKNDTVSLFTLRALLTRPRKPSRDVGPHAHAARKMNRRMAESIVAIASEFARVRAQMSPELWPLWLEAEFRWSPEIASQLVSAAADIEQGRSFNVAGVTHALASLQGGGRP